MGWKKKVHRVTRKCFCRHYTFGKGEVRVEIWVGCDGETMEHAECYRFGKLIDQAHDDHGHIVSKVDEWIKLV